MSKVRSGNGKAATEPRAMWTRPASISLTFVLRETATLAAE